MTHAQIRHIQYHLPANELTNAQLQHEFADWTSEQIHAKTGIRSRFVTAEEECSSDLAVDAARKLFDASGYAPADIDFILLCTQSPDYLLPTTACIVQDRLGIPRSAGALDFNLGCSGWVYGAGLAKGLIESGQARRVLLLTAETYSKFIHPADRSVRTIFGDAAAATLFEAVEAESSPLLGPFVWGTDGSGAGNLIVRTGGMRNRFRTDAPEITDASGNRRTENDLFMNGPEIFNFTLRTVPATVDALLRKAELSKDDVDLFVFHQANHYMLDHLRKKLKIAEEKFFVCMEHCGNTVSSTIPIALRHAVDAGALRNDMRVATVGFGVGYSWAAALIRWREEARSS